MLVQQMLKQDTFSGHLFAFRGMKASMLKVLFWDGNGLRQFTKRLDQGSFVWPVMVGYDGSIKLTPAQLAMLIEGIDSFSRSASRRMIFKSPMWITVSVVSLTPRRETLLVSWL